MHILFLPDSNAYSWRSLRHYFSSPHRHSLQVRNLLYLAVVTFPSLPGLFHRPEREPLYDAAAQEQRREEDGGDGDRGCGRQRSPLRSVHVGEFANADRRRLDRRTAERQRE